MPLKLIIRPINILLLFQQSTGKELNTTIASYTRSNTPILSPLGDPEAQVFFAGSICFYSFSFPIIQTEAKKKNPSDEISLTGAPNPMAISVTASAIPCLSSDRTARIVAAAASSSSSCSKLSSSTSLRFPSHLRHVRIGTRDSRPWILPPVEAKKQTFSSFEDLLATSEKPVLVDFYATWCGPCQFMAPILNEVSITLNDKIQVVKIDTEKYPSIADKYSIQALPTFIIFKDGEPFDRFEGALTADQLVERIETTLKVRK